MLGRVRVREGYPGVGALEGEDGLSPPQCLAPTGQEKETDRVDCWHSCSTGAHHPDSTHGSEVSGPVHVGTQHW